MNPFLSEIRLFPWGFAPRGWAMCNGALLSIAQNQALFSLLGTAYGGDGVRTFGLPDLRGRVGVHAGNQFVQGQIGGEELHTLSVGETPQHVHVASGTTETASAGVVAANGVPTNPGVGTKVYVPAAAVGTTVALNPATLTTVGGSQPHSNMQPYLVLNPCIATAGYFPSRD